MSTKQLLLLAGGVILVLILVSIILLPKHVVAPSSTIASSTSITVSSVSTSTPGYSIHVQNSSPTSTVSGSSATEAQMLTQIETGIQEKESGNYTAAIQSWTQVTQEAPYNFVAFADLGDLYQNFLHEYPQAETNYLAALQRNPGDIDLYRDLYTMYRYQYKVGTSAAANIIAQGLKANPGNSDLLQMQTQLNSGN